MGEEYLSNEEREALKKEFGLTDAELDDKIAEVNAEATEKDIPTPVRKDDVLLFLRDVFKITDSLEMNRTGNLGEGELGRLVLNTRTYNNIANYALTEGYDKVNTYLLSKSSNIITTSTSKKGFFLQLITTSKKITKNIGQKQIQRQSSLFGGTKETIVGGEEE